jgi:excinuclease ABC subunit C
LPEDSPGTVEEAPADAASRAPAEPWQAPDLLVVDGGRGQLSAALAAARDLGLHELAIVALAKQRELGAGEVLADRVFLPGQKNGIPVRPHTALVLLARARDEAHRFANRARERLGKARRLRSGLEGVAGIGEATRRKLLARFGGPRAIREATDEQLAAEAGLGSAQIDALRRHLASIFEAELDETAAEVPSDRAGGRGEGGEPHGR